MSKKNWISVKRGLSEDPKHRQAMGEAIWLFLHIIDAAEWETGIVYDWRDKDIADDMSISQRTVRDWRDRLTGKGYITCERKPHSLNIIIHNWTDPRTYSGKKMNVKQSDMEMSNTEKVIDTVIDTVMPQELAVNPTPFIESTSTSLSSKNPKKDLVDGFIELNIKNQDKIKEQEIIKEQIERGLGVTPNMARTDWETVVRGIQKREKNGQPLGTYITWCRRDKFNSPKTAQIANKPMIILDTWTAAFAHRPEEEYSREL